MSTILVVDDDADVRTLLRRTLTVDGHDVVEAVDGAEALALAPRHLPQLVLLDVMMPERSGWDVLVELKSSADDQLRTIPVVMLTGLGGDVDRVKGGIEGAVRYLAKPFALDELRAAVASVLDGDPEPVQQRRARHEALENLARMERGDSGPPVAAAPRPRLTGLEGSRPVARPPERPRLVADFDERVGSLTPKQLQLLEAVRVAPTVLEAAGSLAMSRSNVYASLRRVSRRLAVRSVSELLQLLRSGVLLPEG